MAKQKWKGNNKNNNNKTSHVAKYKKKQQNVVKVVKQPAAPKFHNVTVSGGDSMSNHSAELKVERFFIINHIPGSQDSPKKAAASVFVLSFDTGVRYMFPSITAPPLPITGQSNTRLRIGKVVIEMLQKPQVDSSDAFTDTMVTVVAQVPVADNSGDSTPKYVATRSTRIQPSVNEKWVEVLNYDCAQLFRQSLFSPYFTTGVAQAICALAVHNPNTGVPVNGKNYNFRATIHFGQPIPVSGVIRSSEFYAQSWDSPLNVIQSYDSSDQLVENPITVLDTHGYVAICGMKKSNT